MKKILKYSLLAVLGFVLAANTGCKKSELDTNQFNGFSLAAVAPNPVMRGGELSLVGAGLENVSEVQFAGNVTITDITVVAKGAQSEIRVMVPLEGPEVGKVTVVAKDGRKASTRFDLTYTEPIVIESFTPTVALSGDVLTFKGEYLNDVKTVIFGGDVMVNEFKSQSRHELKVAVPATALTGSVILSDVDEITDQSSIPNHIYTPEELVIGEPVVRSFPVAKTAKVGDVINVTGEHLDMIETVDLPNAEGIVFEVNELGTLLNFTMPASALSGTLVLTSYDGDVFEVGEVEAVLPRDLTVTSMGEDKRFKAGVEVHISGFDLDLVTKVEFGGNVEADFYLMDGVIITSQPAAAKDGPVTVTMESGVQASTDAIEVVKPDVLGWEHFDKYVAGQTVVTVEGLDLDLVVSAKMGDKKQGFIDCEYELVEDELKVKLPAQAYTGPIVFTSAAGYETETDEIPVSYDMAVSIKFDAPSFSMGKTVSLTGSNLLKIEQVYIKGQKVTDFAVRADDAMTFSLPEKVGPGVYRLELVLTDDSQLTWPVPFEVTAPYTETFFWQGEIDLSGGAQPYLGGDGELAGSLEVGDLIRVYFTAPGDDWWFEIYGGHWDGLLLKPTPETVEPGTGYCVFEVTEDNIGTLTSTQYWGGVLVVQGSVTVTGASVIHFGATETVIYEGPSSHTGDYAVNLELGTEDDWVNAGLTEGSEVRIYFTPDDPNDWSLQVFDGHWGGMSYVTPNGVQWNNENSPEAASKGYVSFIAEGAAYTALTTKAYWGFALIVQGYNLVVDKLSFQ